MRSPANGIISSRQGKRSDAMSPALHWALVATEATIYLLTRISWMWVEMKQILVAPLKMSVA